METTLPKQHQTERLNDEIVGNIFATKNYAKFKPIKGNRDQNIELDKEGNLKFLNFKATRLANSLQEKGQLVPIIVNKNYEVIDGNHRLTILKNLDSSIMYIFAPEGDTKQIITLNSMRQDWKIEDYIKYYANEGYEEYLKFLDIKKEFPEFSVGAVLEVCYNSNSGHLGLRKAVEEGTFKFTNEYISVLECARELYKRDFIDLDGAKYTSNKLSRTLKSLLIGKKDIPNFTLEKFKDKVAKYGSFHIFLSERETLKVIVKLMKRK